MKKITDYFLDGKIAYVAPNTLKPSEDNPRVPLRHADPERFAGLMASIDRGFFTPILVEGSTLEIIGGHQRVDAARERGMKEVPVLFLKDLTPAEKKRIRIADNGVFGGWNISLLREQIAELQPDELPMLGLDAMTLDAIEPFASNENGAKLDEQEEWTTAKFRLPTEAAKRITAILEQVCAKQKCKPPTALTYAMELFAQDPENGIDL